MAEGVQVQLFLMVDNNSACVKVLYKIVFGDEVGDVRPEARKTKGYKVNRDVGWASHYIIYANHMKGH